MKNHGVTALFMAAFFVCTTSAQVQIGDMVIPKERFICYILIGNSNMAGYGDVLPPDTLVFDGGEVRNLDLDTVWNRTDPRLWSFNIQDQFNPGPHHEWIPAIGKIHIPADGPDDAYGPGMGFLKQMAYEYPDYYFGVLQVANNVNELKRHYVNNESGWGGTYYTQLKEALAAINNTVTFGGVLTQLGSFEIQLGASASIATWAQDSKVLAERIRADSKTPNLPYLEGGYEFGGTGAFNPGSGNAQALISQKASMPGLIPFCEVIPTEWSKCNWQPMRYMSDDHHYSLKGQYRYDYEAVKLIKTKSWLPASPDDQPPAAPAAFAAGTPTIVSVPLTWQASTDNQGVKYYTMFRNGEAIATLPSTAVSYSASDLTRATTYSFTLKATDFAGNTSPAAGPVSVTTLTSDDVTPPSVPANLGFAGTTKNSVILSWDAAADDAGILDYRIYKNDQLLSNQTERTLVVDGLASKTTYSFSVTARDPSGNESAKTTPVSVTTLLNEVVSLPLKVNVGGFLEGDYLADQSFSDTVSYGYTFSGSEPRQAYSDGTPVAGTEEDEIFRSVRYDDFGYAVRIPEGKYQVSLMFAQFWNDPGQRDFDISITGTTETWPNYDPAALAGGRAIAQVLTTEIEITAAHNNLMEIGFKPNKTGRGTGPILCGLIVEPLTAFRITSPAPGASFKVGDTLRVAWETNEALVVDAEIQLSTNGGRSWVQLVLGDINKFYPDKPLWENVAWVIPESYQDITIDNSSLRIKVRNYSQTHESTVSVNVGESSTNNSQALAAVTRGPRIIRRANGFAVSGTNAILRVNTLSGRTVLRAQVEAGRELFLRTDLLPNGTYFMTLGNNATVIRKKIVLCR